MSSLTELQTKIVKQLEYYFSDINLAKDKHLRELIEKSENGWISMEEMLKFPRLKMLSEDAVEIIEAIKLSNSDVVEADSEKGIKRTSTDPIPENMQSVNDKYLSQSVYVKGFKSDETMDDIMMYLEKCGGPTLNVFMRKLPRDKKFKGSIFAIFKTQEDADRFMANEESKTYNNTPMIVMWQKDYHNEKQNEYKSKMEEKQKREQQAAEAKEAMVERRMTKGALMEFEGLPVAEQNDENNRKFTTELKTWLAETLKEVGDVAWVDYFSATGKAIVRLNKENLAEPAKVKLCSEEGNTFEFKESKISVSVLADSNEKDYWKTVLNSQDNRKNKRNDRNGGPARKRRRN